MTDKYNGAQMNKALFIGLIGMLSSSAMQQLGKLVNPITKKAETDLEGAQATIDMLGMLRDKTSGNLETDEEKMLNNVLASLQMNYVETAGSAQTEQEQEEETEKTGDAGRAPRDDTENASDHDSIAAARPQSEDEEKRKFHKSYGE